MNGMEVIMKKKSMCRICLVENVRMHVVTNRNLQEVYKKLTDAPFVTEDIRPMLACSFCYTKLKQCWQLQRKCLEAEEVFAQMLNEDYEMKLVRNPSELEYFGGLIKCSTVHVCIFGADEDDDYEMTRSDVEVAPAICETQDDAELQELVLSDELETKYLDDLDLDNISTHQSESDLDLDQKYVPPCLFESDSESDGKTRAVSVEKRRDEKWTLAVKKPEREIQRHTLEDTITDMQETNRHLNVNMICTTNNNTHKSVSKYKEPITDTQQDVYNLVIHKIKACKVVINKLNIPLDSSENFKGKTWHNERDNSDTNRHQSEQKSINCNKRDDINGKNLIVHTRVHTKDKPYKCDVCQKCFSDKRNLIIHTRVHTGGKPYKCDVCQKCFSQQQSLKVHTRVHTGEKPYKCDVCQKCFTTKRDLIVHTRGHSGETPYKCDMCQKCFSHQQSLKVHTRVHTGEKPYKCDVCQKCFSQQQSLKVHTRLHTGEKPYKCDVCQKCFTTKRDLIIHTRGHSGETPYKCDVCQKCFSEQRNLIIHTRGHTGEKPYKCDVCQKCFSQQHNLIVHTRVHTGEKPYKCDMCQKCFSHQQSLKVHTRIHTGEKPYKCDVCQKCFSRRDHLIEHTYIHSGE